MWYAMLGIENESSNILSSLETSFEENSRERWYALILPRTDTDIYLVVKYLIR